MSIGNTLAEARRQAGLTLAQVSQQTRIRESIIRSVEQDDFSPCGGDFYARGHIRSIAEVVGVDSVPLIREYDDEHAPQAMRASQIFEPATPIKIREPRRLHLGRVLAVVLLAVVGFGAYHFVSTRGTHSSATAAAKVRQVVPATPSPKASPSARPSSKPAAPKGTAVIKLTANSDCWVGMTSGSTGQQTPYTIAAGQTKTWTEKHAVTMVVGNPPGVKLTVNGKTVQMNTVQVVTLSINPKSKTPVTVG